MEKRRWRQCKSAKNEFKEKNVNTEAKVVVIVKSIKWHDKLTKHRNRRKNGGRLRKISE